MADDTKTAGAWISELFPARFTVLDSPEPDERRPVRRICPLDKERLQRVYERAVATLTAEREEQQREEREQKRASRAARKHRSEAKQEKPAPEPALPLRTQPEVDVLENDDIIWSGAELNELRAAYRKLRTENRELKVAQRVTSQSLTQLRGEHQKLEVDHEKQQEKLVSALQANRRQQIATRELECELLRVGSQLADTAELLQGARDTEADLRRQTTGRSQEHALLQQQVQQLQEAKSAREEYWRRRLFIDVEHAREEAETQRQQLIKEMQETELELEQEKHEHERDARALSLLQRHFAALPQQHADVTPDLAKPRALGFHCVQQLDLQP